MRSSSSASISLRLVSLSFFPVPVALCCSHFSSRFAPSFHVTTVRPFKRPPQLRCQTSCVPLISVTQNFCFRLRRYRKLVYDAEAFFGKLVVNQLTKQFLYVWKWKSTIVISREKTGACSEPHEDGDDDNDDSSSSKHCLFP